MKSVKSSDRLTILGLKLSVSLDCLLHPRPPLPCRAAAVGRWLSTPLSVLCDPVLEPRVPPTVRVCWEAASPIRTSLGTLLWEMHRPPMTPATSGSFLLAVSHSNQGKHLTVSHIPLKSEKTLMRVQPDPSAHSAAGSHFCSEELWWLKNVSMGTVISHSKKEPRGWRSSPSLLDLHF